MKINELIEILTNASIKYGNIEMLYGEERHKGYLTKILCLGIVNMDDENVAILNAHRIENIDDYDVVEVVP